MVGAGKLTTAREALGLVGEAGQGRVGFYFRIMMH